jgi:hypothetical protein
MCERCWRPTQRSVERVELLATCWAEAYMNVKRILLQTCEYRKVNPLKFLLSTRRQLCWMKDPLIGVG